MTCSQFEKKAFSQYPLVFIKGFIGFEDKGQKARGWYYAAKANASAHKCQSSVITAEMPTMCHPHHHFRHAPVRLLLFTCFYNKRTHDGLFDLSLVRDVKLSVPFDYTVKTC